MVMDRLFLWIFTVAVLVGTAGIILQEKYSYKLATVHGMQPIISPFPFSTMVREAAKKSYLVARPLRKKNFFWSSKNIPNKNLATKLEGGWGGGGKALVASLNLT